MSQESQQVYDGTVQALPSFAEQVDELKPRRYKTIKVKNNNSSNVSDSEKPKRTIKVVVILLGALLFIGVAVFCLINAQQDIPIDSNDSEVTDQTYSNLPETESSSIVDNVGVDTDPNWTDAETTGSVGWTAPLEEMETVSESKIVNELDENPPDIESSSFEQIPQDTNPVVDSSSQANPITPDINMKDFVGTYFLKSLRAYLVIFEQNEKYYINFVISHGGRQNYLNPPVPLTIESNCVTAYYDDDGWGNSGSIEIRYIDGDLFISGRVNGESVPQYSERDDIYSLSVEERMYFDADMPDYPIYKDYLDPSNYTSLLD